MAGSRGGSRFPHAVGAGTVAAVGRPAGVAPARRVAVRAVVVALLALVALLVAGCTAQSTGDWQVLGPSDGSIVLSMIPDPNVPQVVYAGTSEGEVVRTRTDSRTTAPGTGLPSDARMTALAADPGAEGVVYAGSDHGVYITKDYGDTWTALGRGLPAGDIVESLVLLPTNPVTLYAGTAEHGAYRSQDGGATWTPLNAGLPAHANVDALAYDPASQMLFAALAGGTGVFAIAPDGTSWVARSTGLPAQSDVYALLPVAAHDAVPARLYAGTSQGVSMSGDAGQSWSAAGLGSAHVYSLAADPTAPGTLYAGTDNNLYRGVDGQAWGQLAPGISHPVAAIVVRAPTAGKPIVFAGSQDVLRYPPNLVSNPAAGTAVTVLVLVFLAALLFYFGRRSLKSLGGWPRRYGDGGGSSASTGSAESTGPAEPRDAASRNARNGHDPKLRP